MILRKTLLIEKIGDYKKRFYKTKDFWIDVDNAYGEWEYQYSDCDDDYYYDYGYSDEESAVEMNNLFTMCDEENVIENILKEGL